MGIGLFKVGQRFDLDGKRQHITRLLDKERIEFEDAQSARRQELTLNEALDLYRKGSFVFRNIIDVEADMRARARVMSAAMLASVSPELRRLATLRLHFVKKLAHLPCTQKSLAPLIQLTWQNLKSADRELMPVCPSASTVAKWIKRYRDSGNDIVALLDRHALKGHRDRIPQKVKDLMEDCVRDHYLKPEHGNIKSVQENINGLIDDTNLMLTPAEQLKHVSYEQLRRYINTIPAYERYAAQKGEPAANMKFRSTGRGASAELPLQRAEMDHCRLDLFVVDMETGLPLGRPWLTAIIDACTRMILGFSLSFDAPSSLTVMRAIRHALLPKIELNDVANPWPTWGIMRTLVVDNGVEFHGSSLDYAAGQFGITIQTCPRRQPWFKGKIERFFRTLQTDLIAIIPGKTFSSIFQRGDYDSSKHAAISLETLKRVINLWIVDIYHQSKHSSIRKTPAQKWESLIDQIDRHLPDSANWVDAAFGKPDTRIAGHEGIMVDSLDYNCAELRVMRQQLGDRVRVDIITNDENVGYLYVVHPETGDYIKVPAIDEDYASGLTRWQHTKCKEYARYLSEKSEDRVSLREAKLKIVEMIEEDMVVNRRKSRAAQGRARSMRKQNDSKSTTTSARPTSSAKRKGGAAARPAEQNATHSPRNPSVARDDDLLDLTVTVAVPYKQDVAA